MKRITRAEPQGRAAHLAQRPPFPRTLTLGQARRKITANLLAGGMPESAARDTADGYLCDLEDGRTVAVWRLGTLRPQGRRVLLTPPAARPHAHGARDEQTGKPEDPAEAWEAAVQTFMGYGYSRHEAEGAAHIAREYSRR